eukprot:COSAG03_NODE_19_length_21645_cov_17.937532_5_plen_191_part_00
MCGRTLAVELNGHLSTGGRPRWRRRIVAADLRHDHYQEEARDSPQRNARPLHLLRDTPIRGTAHCATRTCQFCMRRRAESERRDAPPAPGRSSSATSARGMLPTRAACTVAREHTATSGALPRASRARVFVFVCVCVCLRVCVRVCVCACVRACVRVYESMGVCVCASACARLRACLRVPLLASHLLLPG